MKLTTKNSKLKTAFTLTELIIVVLMIALFFSLAQVRLFGMLRRNTFRARLQDFVSAMQMAAHGAAESNKRYEVIVDLAEQSYLLRQISSDNLSDVLEEEVIVWNDFGDNCWLAYVEFDDGDFTNEGRARFRVGHAGWQYGGKMVFLDEEERIYSVVVNRLNPAVTLTEGDAQLLLTRSESEIPF